MIPSGPTKGRKERCPRRPNKMIGLPMAVGLGPKMDVRGKRRDTRLRDSNGVPQIPSIRAIPKILFSCQEYWVEIGFQKK